MSLARRALPPHRPDLLGAGERLLEDVGDPRLEIAETITSPAVTHVRYRVVRQARRYGAPMPPSDEELAVRRELERRRDEAQRRVAGLAKRPELGSAQGFGKRIGDGTVEAISRLTEIGVGSSLETGLARVERALAKLGEGTYGSCDTCGGPIAPKRLQVMPDSVQCVGCAAGERRAAPRRR